MRRENQIIFMVVVTWIFAMCFFWGIYNGELTAMLEERSLLEKEEVSIEDNDITEDNEEQQIYVYNYKGKKIYRYSNGRDIPKNGVTIPKTDGKTNNVIKMTTPTGKEIGIFPFTDYETCITLTDGKGEYRFDVGDLIGDGEFIVKETHYAESDQGKTEENIYLDRSYTIDFQITDEVYFDTIDIVNKLSENADLTHEEFARRTAEWVHDTTEYDKELAEEVRNGENRWHNYKNVDISDKSGICTDFAKKYTVLMRVAGIPCKYIIGEKDRSPHAWNEVYINDGWVIVDCVYNKYGGNTTGYVADYAF